MKAAPFSYERPGSLADTVALLADAARYAKVLAGGQSLGPMLNLRLVSPNLLVDVTAIPELRCAEHDAGAVLLGACTTHAAIEDQRVPDASHGAMARIARDIAYRAVRNRGTLGGSLAHADPAADWVTALAALDARAIIHGPSGSRSLPIAQFMLGAFETALEPAEVLQAVRIPKLGPEARFGYYKFCRKTGEFPDAMAAVVWDPERDTGRAVIGATDTRPLVIDDPAVLFESAPGRAWQGPLNEAALGECMQRAGIDRDRYARRIRLVVLRRAIAKLGERD